MSAECLSCGETDGQVCVASKSPCGHHCNHSWSHDVCHWCGTTWGEDGVESVAASGENDERETDGR